MRHTSVRREAGKQQVKDSYEKAWAAVTNRLDRHIEDDNELATILAREGRLRFPGVRTAFAQKQPAAGALRDGVLAEHGVQRGFDNGYYAAVVGGRFMPASSYNPIHALSKRVTPEINIVMELGSGWSANLFQIYVYAGKRRAESVHFIGAEYTESGRECGTRLAKHDGRINYSAPAFDWTKPDLSFLEEIPGPRNVLAFSHHSIEQVEEIDPDIYAQLARYSDSATVMHFEPCGWQRRPELMAKRHERDEEFFNEIRRSVGAGVNRRRATADLTDPETALRASAWWSFARRHNHNLLQAVKASPHATITHKLWDFDSLSNPFNPSTLLDLAIS